MWVLATTVLRLGTSIVLDGVEHKKKVLAPPGKVAHISPHAVAKPKGSCLTESFKNFSVEFCPSQKYSGGNTAGGVFKGTMKCLNTSDQCSLMGLERKGSSDEVVVKFNQVGAEKGKNNMPSVDVYREIEFLNQVQTHPNAIKLYGQIGQRGEKRQIGNTKFWEPGMVLEKAKEGELQLYMHLLHYHNPESRPYKAVRKLTCILEQLESFSAFMIKKGFFHTDMHPKNVLLTGKRYNAKYWPNSDCAVVKVIDFGVVRTFQPAEKLKAVAWFADILDFSLSFFTRKYGYSQGTVWSLFKPGKVFVEQAIEAKNLTQNWKNAKIQALNICRETLGVVGSYCNKLMQMIN